MSKAEKQKPGQGWCNYYYYYFLAPGAILIGTACWALQASELAALVLGWQDFPKSHCVPDRETTCPAQNPGIFPSPSSKPFPRDSQAFGGNSLLCAHGLGISLTTAQPSHSTAQPSLSGPHSLDEGPAEAEGQGACLGYA